MSNNPIINSDSYKTSHWLQYPADTEYTYSYIEARGGEYKASLFFGLQMFVQEYLAKPITQEMIDEAAEFWQSHMSVFNREGWEYILREHNGYLPLLIRAVPEGTLVPTSNVLVTVVNTDPKCFWLTSYIETALLRAVWYPTTVATRSFACKRVIRDYLNLTSDDPAGQLPFKLHDFGFRGVSSYESAGIGGCAHLVNFMGTDTAAALVYARKYYNEPMAGFSIPAAEHSTITSWGRDGEADAYANMLNQFGGQGKLVAVVSDSYDIYNAVTNIWGGTLKDAVFATGGTLVVRPDSGNPPEIVLECVKRLDTAFGSTENSKGFRVLNPTVRVIQGDGINEVSIAEILGRLTDHGYSADNVAFGMGGELLQTMNRDTMRWAMKCSAVCVNGEWRDVQKDPVTDSGKRSKAGRLKLINDAAGEFQTVRLEESYRYDVMEPVYLNGRIWRYESFSTIRERAASYL